MGVMACAYYRRQCARRSAMLRSRARERMRRGMPTGPLKYSPVSSPRRKPGSRTHCKTWIPAFAGMTARRAPIQERSKTTFGAGVAGPSYLRKTAPRPHRTMLAAHRWKEAASPSRLRTRALGTCAPPSSSRSSGHMSIAFGIPWRDQRAAFGGIGGRRLRQRHA